MPATGREIFVNDEIYRQEQEQVFTRSWLFVGHESQVSKPGDYFVSCMGEESVILCRDRVGGLHVFLNSCMHRGMKVCRYDEGNTPVFTCPYHGWQYHLSGELKRAPRAGAVEEFKRRTIGLQPIAVATCCPFVLVNFAGEEAGAAPRMQGRDARQALEAERAVLAMDGLSYVATRVYELPCNWKVFIDNYLDGGYHVPHMHQALSASLERTSCRRASRICTPSMSSDDADRTSK